MFFKNLVLLLLISASLGEDAVKSDRIDFKKSLSKDCTKRYSLTCLKLSLVNWVDNLNEEGDISVYPGVSLVRESSGARSNNVDIVAEIARDFPNNPDTRLDAFLLRKITNFLGSHSLKLNLWDKSSVEEARGGGEGGGGGGGGGGKKGGGMEWIGMIAMWKATLWAIALKGIGLIAAKALMTSLISLMISGIIGLKSLTHHHGHTTYEVVSKPIHTHSHSHSSHEEHGGHYGHSSYGRSFDTPLPLALQGEYKPPQP